MLIYYIALAIYGAMCWYAVYERYFKYWQE